jgi:hypothetical protein
MYTLKIAHLGTLEVVFTADNSLPRLLELAEAEGYSTPAYSTLANAVKLKDYYVTDFLSDREEDAGAPFLFIVQPSLK